MNNVENLLKQVVEYTGRTAQGIADAREKFMFSKSDDKFAHNTDEVLKSFTKLKVKFDDGYKAAKKLFSELDEIQNSAKKLRKEILEEGAKEIKENSGEKSKIFEKHRRELEQLSASMKKFGMNTELLDKGLAGDHLALGQALRELEDDVKGLSKVIDKKALEEEVKSVGKVLKAGMVVAVQQLSQVMMSTLQTGFDPWAAGGGGTGGFLKMGYTSYLMGVTPQEAQEFAARNREVLSSISKSAMISATDALSVAENYGDLIRDTFGAVGPKQLEMLSQGMKTLANLGTPVTQQSWESFVQGVENMAKTSNMTADQIFAEFEQISEMPGMQGLMYALDGSQNAATVLSESFINLQGAVGLNAEEFIKYRKKLAEERRRTGSERVVQAAMARELAASVGGFNPADLDLLQKGRAYRESLTDDDKARYDALENQLGKNLAAARTEALKNEQTDVVQRLDILAEKAGIEEIFGPLLREQSGVVQTQQEYQKQRLDYAREQTSGILKTNALLQEIARGFYASPFGKGGGLIVLLSTLGSTLGAYGGAGGGIAAMLKGFHLSLRAVLPAFVRLGFLGAALVGAFEGLNAALDTHGNIAEKIGMFILEALSSFSSTLTLGLSDVFAEYIQGLLSGSNQKGLFEMMTEWFKELFGSVIEFFGGTNPWAKEVTEANTTSRYAETNSPERLKTISEEAAYNVHAFMKNKTIAESREMIDSYRKKAAEANAAGFSTDAHYYGQMVLTGMKLLEGRDENIEKLLQEQRDKEAAAAQEAQSARDTNDGVLNAVETIAQNSHKTVRMQEDERYGPKPNPVLGMAASTPTGVNTHKSTTGQ